MLIRGPARGNRDRLGTTMGVEHRVALAMLEEAHHVFVDNVQAAYLSFAFDEEPLTWDLVEWPTGLRDTIEPTQSCVDEITHHIDTSGHGIRRPWMSDELVARYEPRSPSDPS
jgi:hypothetical protein